MCVLCNSLADHWMNDFEKMLIGKATKHINIRYFFCADMFVKGQVTVKYCPTEDLIADYLSKPL